MLGMLSYWGDPENRLANGQAVSLSTPRMASGNPGTTHDTEQRGKSSTISLALA